MQLKTDKKEPAKRKAVKAKPRVINKEAQAARQSAYLQRMRDNGMVNLASVFVPKAIANECRALVRKYVADWEAENQL